MEKTEKYANSVILTLLFILVMNWHTLFTLSNFITAISFFVGIIYIALSFNHYWAHYDLVINIAIFFEVIPAYLLIGNIWYTLGAVVLIVALGIKQFLAVKSIIEKPRDLDRVVYFHAVVSFLINLTGNL